MLLNKREVRERSILQNEDRLVNQTESTFHHGPVYHIILIRDCPILSGGGVGVENGLRLGKY